MPGRVWFYLDGRERVGPVTDRSLQALATAGRVFAESYVWTEGLETWTQLGAADGFAGVARPAPSGRVPPAPDRFARMLVPGGRSPWALAAGYLAALSLLVIPAPLAVAAGVAGLRDIRRVERMTGRRPSGVFRCVLGILSGSVFTIALAWLVVSTALR